MNKVSLGTLGGLVGFLIVVELTSGFIQGYYTPMLSDIARHLSINDADVNWFEGSQLVFSAIMVPALAKLGDMFGYKRILMWSTAVTALASLALPLTDSFPFFLIAWTLQGGYVMWLPLEIALIWSRSRGMENRSLVTARAAGILVAALGVGAIVGALLGGQLIDTLPITTVLLVPGVLVAMSFFFILFGVKELPDQPGGRLDLVGLSLISFAIIAFTGGLSLLRLSGVGDPIAWGVVLLGLLLVIPFVLWELRHPDPLIDVRLFRSPALAPVFLTAALFGMSVLGAQAPYSTFLRTDPAVYGYGIGVTGFVTSLAIGFYLISMIVGALLYPRIARILSPRLALVIAAVLVGVGYLLFVPLHGSYAQMVVNIMVAGIGAGALAAALPATAAAAAPSHQTGVATGLTNFTKTIGGAVASALFGIVLVHGLSGDTGGGTAGSLSGYVTVWLVCGISAFAAAAALLFVMPKNALQDQIEASAEG